MGHRHGVSRFCGREGKSLLRIRRQTYPSLAGLLAAFAWKRPLFLLDVHRPEGMAMEGHG